ncbi:MAG: hypothetical protein CVV27_05525 [Candidatus Melainabacteria bacterium HGW-Melainabacteria-1]|nr:MAG: hypothetical protein CVV27_05525 [Candidatus Melainabacteria bacterium HGW-Melainabacteria-1]
MSNFRLTMPSYLESNWNQLSSDKRFDRQDLAALKSAAESQQGSRVQEALETQTLDTLSRQLDASADGSLRLDVVSVHPQSQSVGHAIVEVSLLADSPAEPSQADQTWASALELKMQMQGYQPSSEELARYQNICERYLASREGQPAPSTDELEWANTVQRKTRSGAQPSAEELLRFRDIVARQALHIRKLMAKQPEPTAPASSADLRWAAEIQEKVQTKGYQPSEAEQIRFQQIARAFQKFNARQAR